MSEDAGIIISKCVVSLLAKQKKTQAWLAGEMGIKPGYLSELLNDHPDKRWNADLINSAAKALKVGISALFTDDELAAKIKSLDANTRQEVESYLDFRLSQKSS